MFDAFLSKYKSDFDSNEKFESILFGGSGFSQAFIKEISGKSFNKGIYRTFKPAEMSSWNSIVGDVFCDFKSRISCFGYDWLGRVFALDNERIEVGEQQVLLLEPGTADALELPCNLLDFHNEILIEQAEAALAVSGFNLWYEQNQSLLMRSDCIGYVKPLFLGGLDEPENFQRTDLEVYWDITGQIINQIKGVETGTEVNITK